MGTVLPFLLCVEFALSSSTPFYGLRSKAQFCLINKGLGNKSRNSIGTVNALSSFFDFRLRRRNKPAKHKACTQMWCEEKDEGDDEWSYSQQECKTIYVSSISSSREMDEWKISMNVEQRTVFGWQPHFFSPMHFDSLNLVRKALMLGMLRWVRVNQKDI